MHIVRRMTIGPLVPLASIEQVHAALLTGGALGGRWWRSREKRLINREPHLRVWRRLAAIGPGFCVRE